MRTPAPRPDWSSLFARRTEGIRLGLAVVQGVFEAMGRPAGAVPAVHVVGTNGKGSTAAMIAHGIATLGGAPAGVGRYTSPHLHRVTERVALDGVPVDEDTLWAAVQRVDAVERAAPGPRRLSFFEVLTLAAMAVFEDAGVEALVVEAGLGGRLDATRVVRPELVVVTSIAVDHQQWLGASLGQIAAEKAGVFAAGVPVLSAAQHPDVAQALRDAAARVGCSLAFVAPLSHAPVGLSGAHQRQNAGLALAALRRRWPRATAAALDGVHWPGRLETVVVGAGQVTLDVAHNPAGMWALVRALDGRSAPRPDQVVVGCHPDKDRDGMLQALQTLNVPLRWVGVDDAEAVAAALEALHRAACSGEAVLVCGSHRLVATVRAHLVGGDTGAPDPSDPRTRNG